jgi:hypothetical protein
MQASHNSLKLKFLLPVKCGDLADKQIHNMAALVPIVGVLFMQLKGVLKEAQTSKTSKP